MTNEQKYKDLVNEYKKQKQKRDAYVAELSEHKGTIAAYQEEQKEYIKKAKSLNVDPKNIKSEIDILLKSVSEKIEYNKKLCEKLGKTTIGQ